MKRLLGSVIVAVTIAVPGTALAHKPGTDGGPIRRGCAPINNGATYVGATRVSCSIARQVAAGAMRGQRYERWRCTRVAGFGHCHGLGIRRGGIVHWAVND